MKKTFILILSTVIAVFALAFTANAENTKVKVQIAPFYTEVECISVYNGGVQYPLIMYKDITYLPLTKGVCDRLWLATGFDAEKGFYVVSTQLPYIEDDRTAFGEYTTNYYGVEYDAVIPEYPVYLNGIRIDNSKEEYPFLNFRGITYLPLTYKNAVMELDFNFSWSQAENSIKLYRNTDYGLIEDMPEVTYSVYAGKDENGYVWVENSWHSYTKYADEFGQIQYYPYEWSDIYRYNTVTGYPELIEKLWDGEKSKYFESRPTPNKPVTDKLSIVDNVLFYGETELMNVGQGNTDAIKAFGYEYVIGDNVLIAVDVSYGAVPAPYTSRTEYLFIKNGDSIKQLTQYDGLNVFDNIYPDGKGGAYICTRGYLPMGSGRWVSPYSTIYYLNSKGSITDLSAAYPDINSLHAIGFSDGKLYVQAMYYGIEKSEYAWSMPFSTVNSGYYVIDCNDGNSITKLYPYVEGEAIVTDGGDFILIASYAQKPRIINLKTHRISILG